MIVYSICAGAFVFVILLCTVCRRQYKQVHVKFKRYQTAYRRNRNIQEMSLPNIPLEEIEGIYEVIDESNMTDNFGIIVESNRSISDANERNSQTNSNSYLTPCQPDEEELNTNNSIDNKSERSSLSQSDANHPTTGDRESTSSNSDIQNNRSSYLNPYQPIVHSPDIHEYLSIHNSGSSGSETLIKEANYLNPYQPIYSREK
ncbi:unnamed protein product [Mytilus coruscus]|uniref:Uncharacterized protein n=1 Tax=Mytilus coruscus TaxID=42192 RepID=A0A6J8D5L7_MYTCO|nr:unnamed protein product [Mytilus coruscus]